MNIGASLPALTAVSEDKLHLFASAIRSIEKALEQAFGDAALLSHLIAHAFTMRAATVRKRSSWS